jgi:hypothetical protein
MSTFDLAQGLKLVMVWIQKAFFGRTPRDVREYTKPPSFEYAIYYANFLFVFAVGAIYGVLAPLVMIFTAVVFWASLACYKYNFMYVNVSKVESGGALWRGVVNRLLVTLVLMQVILMFVVSLDDTTTLTDRIIKIALCAPPIALVIMFKVYCINRFDAVYDWYIPDASEMAKIQVHTGDQRHHRLQRRFGHPSLHQKLFTPMVHARVKHLLPQVYRGRIEESGTIEIAGRKMEAEEVMGGLKIAAVEESQLEYDPRKDSDMMSLMSASTRLAGARKGTADTAFQSQYNQYIASGNVSRTDLGDTYEMNALRDSSENLLEKRGAGYIGEGAMHTRKPSGNTLYSYGTPYGTPMATPGLEYPPGTQDLGQQRMTHHANPSGQSFGSMGGNYFTTSGAQPGYSSPVGRQPSAGYQYNANSPYAGQPPPQPYQQTNGQHVRQQRSNGSFGVAAAMAGAPRRSESPMQMSPSNPALSRALPPQPRQTPSPMPMQAYHQAPFAAPLQSENTPTPGSYYDAADMYSSGGQYQPPRQANGYSSYTTPQQPQHPQRGPSGHQWG